MVPEESYLLMDSDFCPHDSPLTLLKGHDLQHGGNIWWVGNPECHLGLVPFRSSPCRNQIHVMVCGQVPSH